MQKKFVYYFDEGKKEMKSLLGGKGANLAEMTTIGLPVPPGFTISTEACLYFFENNENTWPELESEIAKHLSRLENETNKKFSDNQNPLLVSIRSGAPESMPGMMDTILNLGLNDESVIGLANSTQNERLAYDSYRRFIQMFSDVVYTIPKTYFDKVLDDQKQKSGAQEDTELTVQDLQEIVDKYKGIFERETRTPFPQDPREQLNQAIKAVFLSWNNDRAIFYRNMNNIPHTMGTAVNVQAMVFGNTGEQSGTGVCFTRNPATGENELYGEFLLNAQGEDVVAGIRTPEPISQLEKMMPAAYNQLLELAELLEEHYADMQDIEFTIENNKLYMLQTRSGKRTAQSALKVAHDLHIEGKISKEEAVLRITPEQLDQLLHPKFDDDALAAAQELGKGLAASPGAASGQIYFSAEDVQKANAQGLPAILVREETSPEDIVGMDLAEGILTTRGGMTSHAAVVARGMGKCCIVSASGFQVNESRKEIRYNGGILKEGDVISLDGSTGLIYGGDIDKAEAGVSEYFQTIMEWADEERTMGVYANGDTAKDLELAFNLGAEGVGLVRTEHMFFEEDRIPIVREMILSNTTTERETALAKLLPMQQSDFESLYRVAEERAVTIRLLDPPLHEFLPTNPADIEKLAEAMKISVSDLEERINELEEINPMLGHRGVRLAITYPEIYQMQVQAIINAALVVSAEKDLNIRPKIMIPLIHEKIELDVVKEDLEVLISEILEEEQQDLTYEIGTMIEIPRATLTADKIAETADFFSYGTNDLTQMVYGFSRDDAGKFIPEYESKGVLPNDPFASIDQEGVGQLVEMATVKGRATNPNLEIGVCGEHGGDPASVKFFHNLGLNYVSCSPFRVPIARLVAAQSAIQDKQEAELEMASK